MQDILKLGQDATYTLQAEKVTNKWWLELIERATGNTWIIYCDTKKHAQSFFKNMSMPECKEWMDRLKITPVKMYKKGVM